MEANSFFLIIDIEEHSNFYSRTFNLGHIRSIFDNEPLEQEYYLKKHPGRQLIGEVYLFI